MSIKYDMMDKNLFLCKCMHGGPILEKDLGKTVSEVSEDTVKQILSSGIEKYGSCAVLAIDKGLHNAIIGLLFFYPKLIFDIFKDAYPCIQDPKEINKITPLLKKIISAPSFDGLKDKDKILKIACMQTVGKPGKIKINDQSTEYRSYTSKGIGDGMLNKLISWARDYGWKKIQSTAVPDIKPLKLWWGNQSLNGFLKRGFTIVNDSEEFHEVVLEAVENMKKGLHGKDFQAMWKNYESISDREIATTYQVELIL